MGKKLKVVIVIVNYKTYGDLSECLEALDKQEDTNNYSLTTIIIDSEYQLKEVKKLKKKYPRHIFILQDVSYGFSANFNKGIKKAITMGADFILMISPDVYLQKNVLKTLIKRISTDNKLGAVTCKTLLPTVPQTIYFVSGTIDPVMFSTSHVGYLEEDKNQYDALETTDYLNGAVILMRAKVFQEIGFWEPSYFLYYEDADWTIRLRRAGYKLLVVKNVFAIHDESKTVGKRSMQKEYYMARNHLLFIKRNAPFKTKLLAYILIIKNSLELLPNLLDKKLRERAYYILLGRKDFLFGKLGFRPIKN